MIQMALLLPLVKYLQNGDPLIPKKGEAPFRASKIVLLLLMAVLLKIIAMDSPPTCLRLSIQGLSSDTIVALESLASYLLSVLHRREPILLS